MKTTMKQIATAFFFGVCLLGTLLPVRSQETQVERRHTKKKAEIPDQLQVKPGTRITNPEFIRRLADPEVNLEFGRRYPDASQRLQAAQALADQFCTDLNISISLGSDAQGCYMDVTYVHTYTYGPGTNACWLPHGIYVEMCPGVQITSAQVLSGAWFTGATFGSNPSGSAPWNAVWWVKSCPAWNNYGNIIPSGQTLTVRLRIPAFCAGTSCVVTVRELTGWAYPNNVNFWSCQKQDTIIINSIAYSIGSDTSVCTGSATTICITPTPPPGAQVTWYKYTGTPCPPANCLTSPPWQAGSPWQQAQVGGNCYNTNILTQTTCYVAVVSSGCATAVTNVKKIEVCPGPPSATIVATPASGFPSPTVINGVDHACTNWQGQLCLNPSTFPCPTTIVNWTVNGLPVPNSAGQTCINTGLLTLKPATACSTTYVFQATLKNACGTTTPTWKIVIDRPPDPGSITANPPPPLCFDRSTMLKHTTSCGKVVEWEKREELDPPCSGRYGPWTVIPGSQGTSVWWTNDLQKTTQYRVKVENGACPPVYSPVYTVTVKPKLEVTISANNTNLCGPVILTATYTWGPPCNYSVTYQWYQDGVPIPGATGPTYSPTAGGNYYVVVDGGPCGKAKSNVITICDRPQLEIIGDCCVCPGETIKLCAQVLWSPQNCQPPSCTYQWYKNNVPIPGATTQCIQVSTPGDYSVIVNCDGCKLTRTFNVGSCATSGNNADLTIGKRAPALPWQVNQPAQFDISVNNQGPGSVPAGTPITVTDYIPAGMDYTGSSGTGWSCTPPPPPLPLSGPVTVTCTYTGGLAPGQAAPILTLNVTPTKPGGFENCAEVTLPLPDPKPGNNKNCTGGEVQPPQEAKICIFKFNDLNGNGTQDPNEPPLSGWSFTVSPSPLPQSKDTVRTGSNGSICFGVTAPGTYTITEIVQPGWTSTTPNPQTVTVAPGQLVNVYFGNKKNEQFGTLCIQKFNDLNGNGVRDSGEVALSGWTIFVKDSSGAVIDTVITQDSVVCVSVPAPGTYVVNEVVQSGWTPTTLNPQTVAVQPGQTVNMVFGNIQALKWYKDLDGDGFGVCNDWIWSNAPQGHYSASQCGDCDDTNPIIWPGHPEFPDGIDNDCDGLIDEP